MEANYYQDLDVLLDAVRRNEVLPGDSTSLLKAPLAASFSTLERSQRAVVS